ncbi:MAG: hypothetical protein ABIP75_03175 [Pyrinomonadaceae bacterium]
MIKRHEAILYTFPQVFFRYCSVWDFVRGFYGMNNDESSYWLAKMANQPKVEVPYCYIVIGNRIRYRAQIAGFEPGGPRTFPDGHTQTAKGWMILTAPVISAPYPIKRRGFQGFRYSEFIF